jgi:hypothetical protein
MKTPLTGYGHLIIGTQRGTKYDLKKGEEGIHHNQAKYMAKIIESETGLSSGGILPILAWHAQLDDRHNNAWIAHGAYHSYGKTY